MKSVVLMAVATACLASCGGEDRGRPSGATGASNEVPEPDPCRMADGWETQPITAFEPRNATTRGTSCTNCDFYFNYDLALSPPQPTSYAGCRLPPVCPPGAATESSVLSATANLLSEPIEGGRCGMPGSAFHYTAKDLAVCATPEIGRPGWGGGLNITFRPNPNMSTYDASAWDGVSFWVRKGSPSSKSALLFLAVDAYTAGLLQVCDALDPSCTQIVPDSGKCDPFGQAVTLTSDWTFYALRFADLRQKGFGTPSSQGKVDPSKLVRVQFMFSSGDWDFFIDDINFFRAPKR